MRRLVLILIAITMCLTGCMGTYKHPSDINEMALRYIENRYNDRFEYEGPYGSGMNSSRQILYKSEKLDSTVMVQVENTTISDNYLAVKYRQDTIDFLYKHTMEKFSNCEIKYKPAKIALSADIKANASFNDYISDESCFVSAIIKLKASELNSKEQVEIISKNITDICKTNDIYLTFVFMSDTDYKTVDEDRLLDYIANGEFIDCANLTRFDNSIKLNWLDKDLNTLYSLDGSETM